MTLAATTPAAAANEFLDLAARENGVPPVDQMKLQKLLFYAHAWYLALTGKPLFDEDFEAWPWGPVVKSVYYQTAACKRNPVNVRLSQFDGAGSLLDRKWVTPNVPDGEIKDFIKGIWDLHKNLSGVQLSNATHAPGEPWTIIKDAYDDNLSSKPVIPNSLIEAIFKAKIANDN